MDHPIFTTAVLLTGCALAVIAQWRGWRPSLRASLAVGVGLRLILLVSAASDSWQPVDFLESFQPAGRAILEGQDPVLASEGGWHFLPMIPYLYALPLAAGLPWEIAGRLWTIVADIGLILLVGKLARGLSGGGGARRAVLTGMLFGLALSAKSWPIVLLPVVLAMLPTWRQRLYGLVAAGAVPLFFLVTLPVFVSTSVENVKHAAEYLGGVRPIVGEWGWTALLTGGDWKLVPEYSMYGQIVLYSTLLIVALLWRRANRIDQTSAML